VPNLAELVDLKRFTLGESRYVLLELPFYPWDTEMIRQLYQMPGLTGLTPVIAHLERYLMIQPRKRIQEVLDLGVPVQVSADELLNRTFSRGMKMLRQGGATLVASDCHDNTNRRPNLGPAMAVVAKRLGVERAVEVARWSDRLAGRKIG
jgi:protein-tyrosine phosphatase